LGGERKAGLLRRDASRAEGSGFGATFIAFVSAGQGCGTFRGGKPPVGWRRGG
jgi:hypothetical protein